MINSTTTFDTVQTTCRLVVHFTLIALINDVNTVTLVKQGSVKGLIIVCNFYYSQNRVKGRLVIMKTMNYHKKILDTEH